MTRLNTPSGWGTVLDPETNERVPVGEDLDSDVAKRIADEYSSVEIADETAEEGDSDTDDGSIPFDPSEYTIAELEDKLEGSDYSEETLRELGSVEKNQKDRNGALRTIADALED